MTGLTRANPVRVIDAFVDALDIAELGFEAVEPAVTSPFLLRSPAVGSVPSAGISETESGKQRRIGHRSGQEGMQAMAAKDIVTLDALLADDLV